MTPANEKLVAVQRTKAIYRNCLKEERIIEKRREYKEKIEMLSQEESKLLSQMDVI